MKCSKCKSDMELRHVCERCGDRVPVEHIEQCELELIACYDGSVFWYLDYRFTDDSGNVFFYSQIYKDDKAAIFALMSGTIKWEECHVENGPYVLSELDKIKEKLDKLNIDNKLNLGLVPGCSYEGPRGHKDRNY